MHGGAERAEAGEGQRFVVVPEGLVGVAALFVDEPRQKPAEPEDRVVRLFELVADVTLHHAQAPRLDLGAAEVAGLEVVHHVERVDEKLLVRGRHVAAGRSGEHVFADGVARVVGEVEHVDRLVGRLEIALAQPELREGLVDGAPIEDEQRIVAAEVARQVFVGAHAELLVDVLDGLPRLTRVERGARLDRPKLVTAAPREGLGNDEKQRPAERKAVPFHRTILVTYALCCQRIAPVSISRTCMKKKYCTRRASSVRSSDVCTLPVKKYCAPICLPYFAAWAGLNTALLVAFDLRDDLVLALACDDRNGVRVDEPRLGFAQDRAELRLDVLGGFVGKGKDGDDGLAATLSPGFHDRRRAQVVEVLLQHLLDVLLVEARAHRMRVDARLLRSADVLLLLGAGTGDGEKSEREDGEGRSERHAIPLDYEVGGQHTTRPR